MLDAVDADLERLLDAATAVAVRGHRQAERVGLIDDARISAVGELRLPHRERRGERAARRHDLDHVALVVMAVADGGDERRLTVGFATQVVAVPPDAVIGGPGAQDRRQLGLAAQREGHVPAVTEVADGRDASLHSAAAQRHGPLDQGVIGDAGDLLLEGADAVEAQVLVACRPGRAAA